jgi:hypothetical protein
VRSARLRVAIAAAALLVSGSGSTLAQVPEGEPPPAEHPWAKRVAAAKRFAAQRQGTVGFAVVDEQGRVRGYNAGKRFESASVVKVMLMLAYLRQGGVRDRDLNDADRDLLAPMIKRSANGPASTIFQRVGAKSLDKLADEAAMKHFSTNPVWGATQITPRGQAEFLFEFEHFIPERHRAYALRLLAEIIPPQRWGIPPAVPQGFQIHFKGGWAPETGGWKVNQVALLTDGDRRLALAVLSRDNPSQGYGHGTIRGVAERLLRAYPQQLTSATQSGE